MKILVVSEYFHPDIFAINGIVHELVVRGHDVTVLTGLPDSTHLKIPKEYKFWRKRCENYQGAKVFRVSTIARRQGMIWRSLCYLSFVFSGNYFVWKRDLSDFDVVYVWQASPVTMAVPGIKVKKRYGTPLFLYCLDLWPESIKAMGFKEDSFFFRIIKRWSQKIYRACDHIAVSSQSFFDYLEELHGIDRDKMSYLPQYASSEMLESDFRKTPNGHIDFTYIGNIGKVQDMDCLVRAIALLKDRIDVTFHIIGGGTSLEETKKMAQDTGADRIMIFYGPLPFGETMKYYKNADACVITLAGDNRIGDTLPGRLQRYMAAGKPLFGAMNGAGQEVIRESGSGSCVNAGDYEGLANAFLDYIHHPEKYENCGENARVYFKQHFTEEMHFARLERQLRALIKDHKSEKSFLGDKDEVR